MGGKFSLSRFSKRESYTGHAWWCVEKAIAQANTGVSVSKILTKASTQGNDSVHHLRRILLRKVGIK